jgi:hypothetical protein
VWEVDRLGCAKDHSNDVYRFLNLKTNKVIKSQYDLWLKKSYGEWKGLKTNHIRLDPVDDEEYEFIDRNADDPQDLEARRENQAEFVDIDIKRRRWS